MKLFQVKVASAAHGRPGKMAIAAVLVDLVVATVVVVLAARAVPVVVAVVVVQVAPAVMTLPQQHRSKPQHLPPLNKFPYNSNF